MDIIIMMLVCRTRLFCLVIPLRLTPVPLAYASEIALRVGIKGSANLPLMVIVR